MHAEMSGRLLAVLFVMSFPGEKMAATQEVSFRKKPVFDKFQLNSRGLHDNKPSYLECATYYLAKCSASVKFHRVVELGL